MKRFFKIDQSKKATGKKKILQKAQAGTYVCRECGKAWQGHHSYNLRRGKWEYCFAGFPTIALEDKDCPKCGLKKGVNEEIKLNGHYIIGDKVEYINLESQKIEATVMGYETVTKIICGKVVVTVCARLSNDELVNDRHLLKN